MSQPQLEKLEFVKQFDNCGKQGIVGLCKIDSKQYVFKVSKYYDNTVLSEYTVMSYLNCMYAICPHFVRCYGSTRRLMDLHYKTFKNKDYNLLQPPATASSKRVGVDMLVMEYIKGDKLFEFIEDVQRPFHLIFSLIKQTLAAIMLAQMKTSFTHYDLHSDNIIIRECDPNSVMLYIFDSDLQLCVPTYGHYPVIIDYGVSYCKQSCNTPVYSTLSNTDIGFTPTVFDRFYDARLLLISTLDDFKRCRRTSPETQLAHNVLHHIWGTMDIDWKSGWDKHDDSGAISQMIHIINSSTSLDPHYDSKIFSTYTSQCLDLILSIRLIPLKFTPFDQTTFLESYKCVVTEYTKIESQMSGSSCNLYIIKQLCHLARIAMPMYSNNTTRSKALSDFKCSLHMELGNVAKYCNPKKLHYERLLCGLIILSGCLESFCASAVSEKQRLRSYDNLPLQTMAELYGAIDVNFETPFTFNKDTAIYAFDLRNNTRFTYTLSTHDDHDDIISQLNKTHTLFRGSILYDKKNPK